MAENRIHAKEAISDIKAGMDDAALMAKYHLSARGLQNLIKKLEDSGVLSASEVQARPSEADDSLVIDYTGLTLPDPKKQTPAPAGRADQGEAPLALIISDDGTMTGLIVSALGAGFIRTSASKDAQITADTLAKFSPHFVILDVNLTRADFLDVLHTVHNIDDCMPVLLISDAAHRPQAARGIQQGAYGVLEKPLEPILARSVVSRCAEYRGLALLKRDDKRIVKEVVEEQTAETIRTRDFFKAILDSSTLVSIVAADMKHNILYWNAGAEYMLGYSANEMLGSSATRIYPAESLTLDDEGGIRPDVRLEAADGSALSVALAVTPLKSDDGDVQGIVGVGLDLAEGLWENKEQQKLVHKMTQAQDAAILVLARLIEMRGGHRGGHLDRMQEYCRVLCVSLAKLGTFGDVVDNRFTEDLVRAAIFHDVGETLLPDTVLLFEGEYGPKEREIMRQHAEIGGRALKEAAAGLGTESYLTVAAEVALYHHERWDGTGYPSGLKGRDIPLSARIVAVADSYDALTSEKTYRKAYSHEEACTIIKDEKGTHFDPNVIDAFEDLEGAFRMTRMAFEE